MNADKNKEEFQKCKDSPVYFYNKYVRKEGQRELTEAEFEEFVKQVEYYRKMPLKFRSHYEGKSRVFYPQWLDYEEWRKYIEWENERKDKWFRVNIDKFIKFLKKVI